MWFPITVFAATGFEHAIANMAFVPLGLLYGADADYRRWLCQNLLLVILGNVVGGGLVVGGAGYFLYDWTRVLASAHTHPTALVVAPPPRPTMAAAVLDRAEPVQAAAALAAGRPAAGAVGCSPAPAPGDMC